MPPFKICFLDPFASFSQIIIHSYSVLYQLSLRYRNVDLESLAYALGHHQTSSDLALMCSAGRSSRASQAEQSHKHDLQNLG